MSRCTCGCGSAALRFPLPSGARFHLSGVAPGQGGWVVLSYDNLKTVYMYIPTGAPNTSAKAAILTTSNDTLTELGLRETPRSQAE